MENILAFKALMQVSRNAVIVTHFKPDADALGSSLGLSGFLKKKGHHVNVITPSDYPAFLSWMPGQSQVLALSKENPEPLRKAQQMIETADVIFCLDFSSLNRIEDLQDIVRNAKGTKVCVDHHLEPEKFAQFSQWDPAAASTAGLIFKLIGELGETQLIDAD